MTSTLSPISEEPMSSVDEETVGLDEPSASTIKLKSKEGKVFEVDRKVASLSKLIKTAMDDSDDEVEIELNHIETDIVEKIIEFLKYHAEVPCKPIPKPLPTANLAEHVCEWDAKFADVDQDVMFRTMLAANFMDIPPLLDLMCAKVASLLKGRTPDEIRKTFNIRHDYSPEEEQAVMKEYADLLE